MHVCVSACSSPGPPPSPLCVSPLCWAAGNKQGSTEGYGRAGHCAGVAGGTGPDNPPLMWLDQPPNRWNAGSLGSVLTNFQNHCAFLYFVLELSPCHCSTRAKCLMRVLSTWYDHSNIYVFKIYIYFLRYCTLSVFLLFLFFWLEKWYYVLKLLNKVKIKSTLPPFFCSFCQT